MEDHRVVAALLAHEAVAQQHWMLGRGNPRDELRVVEVFRVGEVGEVHRAPEGELGHAGRRLAEFGVLAHGLRERLLRALELHVSGDEPRLVPKRQARLVLREEQRALRDVAHLLDHADARVEHVALLLHLLDARLRRFEEKVGGAVVEVGFHLFHGHARVEEEPDGVHEVQLLERVVAVAVLADFLRLQQAHLIVMDEQLLADVAHPGELSRGEQQR